MKEEFKAQYSTSYGAHYSPAKPDYSRCAESVHERGMGVSFHQCQRKNGYGPEGAWCKQHDPVEREKREADKRKKWDAEWEEKKRAAAQRRDDARLRPIFEAALRKIADGSNDPRADAETALRALDDEK